MIFLLNITRTDNLGESREEAKKLLEEVEAMEREAHQVFESKGDIFGGPCFLFSHSLSYGE